MWSTNGFGMGGLILVGTNLLVLKENGQIGPGRGLRQRLTRSWPVTRHFSLGRTLLANAGSARRSATGGFMPGAPAAVFASMPRCRRRCRSNCCHPEVPEQHANAIAGEHRGRIAHRCRIAWQRSKSTKRARPGWRRPPGPGLPTNWSWTRMGGPRQLSRSTPGSRAVFTAPSNCPELRIMPMLVRQIISQRRLRSAGACE